MRDIYHITEDISRASGGVRTVVFDIQEQFPASRILTTSNDKEDPRVIEFPKKGPWLYSDPLKQHLQTLSNNALFHLHGVWMHAQLAAAKIAVKQNTPFLLTPHGMYEPWLWKQGTVKKKIYFHGLASSAFAKAKYIHAITHDEKVNLQKLFPKTEVVYIPNAIKIEPVAQKIKPSRPYFLFLGRLHPKKGLELLIEVFLSLKLTSYDLKIVGTQNDYSIKLAEKISHLKESRIQFLGEVRGDEKNRLYRNAHVFIAPSHSEVVGMVNLEAAKMATPVITTYQTGLLKEWNNHGGRLINPTYEELKRAILEVAQWPEEQRDINGENLRKFVIEHYSWDVIKPQWDALYASMT